MDDVAFALNFTVDRHHTRSEHDTTPLLEQARPSKHWSRWLGVENRCVVPFTSFANPIPAQAGRRADAERLVRDDAGLSARLLRRQMGATSGRVFRRSRNV